MAHLQAFCWLAMCSVWHRIHPITRGAVLVPINLTLDHLVLSNLGSRLDLFTFQYFSLFFFCLWGLCLYHLCLVNGVSVQIEVPATVQRVTSWMAYSHSGAPGGIFWLHLWQSCRCSLGNLGQDWRSWYETCRNREHTLYIDEAGTKVRHVTQSYLIRVC